MPVDTSTRIVDVEAPPADVLAVLRDVEAQPEWIPEILEAELLEVYEDSGLPATARFKASATVGTDGRSAVRFAEVTASARIFPPLM